MQIGEGVVDDQPRCIGALPTTRVLHFESTALAGPYTTLRLSRIDRHLEGQLLLRVCNEVLLLANDLGE